MSGPYPKKMNNSVSQDSPMQSRRGGRAVSRVGTGLRHQTTVRSSWQSGAGSSIQKKNANVVGANVDKSINTRFPVRVYDEDGVDVTPLPIVINQMRFQSLGDTTVSSPTDLLSQFSTGITSSAFGGGPFSRSVFSHSFETTESVGDEESRTAGSDWADIRQKRAEVKEELTESDLDKMVTLVLEETDTLWLLNTPTICVAVDGEEAESVALDNALYAKLCKSRAGNDLYTEREMNTFNEAVKYKAIQVTPVVCLEKGVDCTNFDMADTYAAAQTYVADRNQAEEEKLLEAKEPEKEVKPPVMQQVKPYPVASKECQIGSIVGKAGSGAGSKSKTGKERQGTVSMSPGDSVLFPSYETVTVNSGTSDFNEKKVLQSEDLKEDLFFMERVVNLNTYQSKQAVYRGFNVITEEEEENSEKSAVLQLITSDDMGPNLARLWSYSCPLTKGHNAACMAWNRTNPDLLAVGYGQFDFTGQKNGLICCWCLKNPEFPERIYSCKSGVTALDFSEAHPSILAAGYYDGRVGLYSAHSSSDEPLLDSQKDCSVSGDQGIGETHNKHLGPVWQLHWVEKERGPGEKMAEVLVSVSTDGHVMQWTIRNGFECFDIMRLKKAGTRTSNAEQTKEKKDEAIISRYAGGLCFDFDDKDHNTYLVGTEEGNIHKCSCSYNEQYLETYYGHSGPVYRVRWSPFMPDLFLSCSADWSLCLWHQELPYPVLTFHSSTKQVPDLCWSPRSSTVFACVNESAVEVWDLSQSTLDPVITLNPVIAVKLASITFCQNTDCILVGDSEGQVTVYELRCMPPYPTMQNQARMLYDVLSGTAACQKLNLEIPEDMDMPKNKEREITFDPEPPKQHEHEQQQQQQQQEPKEEPAEPPPTSA